MTSAAGLHGAALTAGLAPGGAAGGGGALGVAMDIWVMEAHLWWDQRRAKWRGRAKFLREEGAGWGSGRSAPVGVVGRVERDGTRLRAPGRVAAFQTPIRHRRVGSSGMPPPPGTSLTRESGGSRGCARVTRLAYHDPTPLKRAFVRCTPSPSGRPPPRTANDRAIAGAVAARNVCTRSAYRPRDAGEISFAPGIRARRPARERQSAGRKRTCCHRYFRRRKCVACGEATRACAGARRFPIGFVPSEKGTCSEAWDLGKRSKPKLEPSGEP